uniref:B-cell receptor CD22-like n=1 Tax=Sphaeramia orbicularis TaxID=375764 RepID=A0A672Z0P1_9TELE
MVHLPHAREDQCEGRFSGPVTSVRDPNLQVNVNRGGVLISSWTELRCVSECCLPSQPSYIWYKNGHRVEEESSVYRDIFDNVDSVYCAVKGLENFPSPQICVHMNTCNNIIYMEQKMIAFSGSSVDISCSYSGRGYDGPKFWFSPERSHLWRNLSTPEDLSRDPQYNGRVKTSVGKGRSTLTITNLRGTDSAQYRFQIGGRFNTLPGTTLFVIALQVQGISVTVSQAGTEAELRCQSSCIPAGPLSYVWFQNGQKHRTENSSTYTDQFQPGDNVSCAFIGYEDYRSPSIEPCRLPSVSVSPSGQIVEGSSVTLSCSSDVKAAADYTWYKEDEDSPVASGQIFTITHVRLEHSGNYYCEVQDSKGRYKSMVHLFVVTKNLTVLIMNIIRLTLLVLLVLSVLLVNLWTRKKKGKTQRFNTEPTEFVEMRER